MPPCGRKGGMLATEAKVREIGKDLKVLGKFVETYCKHHHKDAEKKSRDDSPAVAGYH